VLLLYIYYIIYAKAGGFPRERTRIHTRRHKVGSLAAGVGGIGIGILYCTTIILHDHISR